MDQNPLPLGVAAMGLGLTVGLLVSETSMEDRMMGEARDKAMDQAEEKARETVDKARGAAEKVEHVAGEMKDAAASGARQEGRSSQ